MTYSAISQPIAEFSISKLHGERNVKISFDESVKIIVAENGCGKTTILNCLYALLYGNYVKFVTLEFENISLQFKSGRGFKLRKVDFIPQLDQITHLGMLQHFKSFLTTDNIAILYMDYKSLSRESIRNSYQFSIALVEVKKRFGVNFVDENLIQWLDALNNELAGAEIYGSDLNNARLIIKDEFPFDAIYLPTYRRIEEDLRNLTSIPIGMDVNKAAIQFGMSDVKASFDQITAEIRNSSLEWYAKINGQMLDQLITVVDLPKDTSDSFSDMEGLRIVLERTGSNMSPQNKENIRNLILSKEISEDRYAPLAYFLSNLMKVYEQQKDNDNAIKKFTERCNKYLVGKEVHYNESAVEISIKRKKNNHTVLIDTLSSGEKQIISLFSRLFLTKSKQVAIFFDEPELSLSLEWQKQLLPDILESGVCAFLICMTHSPFIFENELAPYTVGLDQYIEEL
jgi:predicted ATPase